MSKGRPPRTPSLPLWPAPQLVSTINPATTQHAHTSGDIPTDLERDLQSAIDDINASLSGVPSLQPEIPAFRKTKRPREAENDLGGSILVPDEELKKKKKKKSGDHLDAAGLEGGEEETRPKKKKKDKGKQREAFDANASGSNEAMVGLIQAQDNAYMDHALAPYTRDSPYMGYDHVPQHQPPAQNSAPPDSSDFQTNTFIPALFNSIPSSSMSATTSEDILKALQQIDLSKFAKSLRTMSMASGNMVSANEMDSIMAAGESAEDDGEDEADGAGPVARPKKPRQSVRRPIASQAVEDDYGDMDHATLLATKWLNPAKLADLVKKEGLQYKKGKFSAHEEDLIQSALRDYRITKNLSEDALREVIFAKGKKAREANATFWSEITMCIPQRPIIAVYHHIRRMSHPMGRQGKWTPEEDALLRDAVTEFGQMWEKVSVRVGRMSSDCRDRWRNHIQNREQRVSGAWTPEEEEELTRIVRELTTDVGKNAENDIFWGVVSERMNNTRTRQQCRIKWTDALNKRVKNSGTKPRWSAQDAYILVQKIASLHISHDSEIDWKLISDSDWNLWSAHQLQRRWFRLKKGVKGSEDIPFKDLIDILKEKKSLPPTGSLAQKKGQSKVTIDDDLEEDSDGPPIYATRSPLPVDEGGSIGGDAAGAVGGAPVASMQDDLMAVPAEV